MSAEKGQEESMLRCRWLQFRTKPRKGRVAAAVAAHLKNPETKAEFSAIE